MLNLTLNDFLSYWPHISTFGGLAMVALMWRMRSEFATTASVAGVSADIATLGIRVAAMERDMRDLPKREDIHAIQLGMADIKGQLGQMRAEAGGDRKLLERVEIALARHDDIFREGKQA